LTVLSSIPFWIIAILILGLLILVHEFGHYITGRLLKFKIEEFSIGMGPKLISKVKNGIRYSLRAIPMGGFVAFHGEDGENGNDTEAMNNQPAWKRAIVMFAGAGFNIIFAFLLTAILTCAVGYAAPRLSDVDENAPITSVAQEGDFIYAVNGHRIVNYSQLSDEIARIADDEVFEVTLLRDGEKIKFDTQKFYNTEAKTYMVGITYYGDVVEQNLFEAFGYSFKFNVWMAKYMYKTLGQLVTGKLSVDNVTGPISTIGSIGGIVQDTYESEEINSADKVRAIIEIIVFLLVIISLNLAIMNLLPFPALDGFRLLFAIIEIFTHKHLPRKAEQIINTAGLLILVGLMIVIEVVRLFV